MKKLIKLFNLLPVLPTAMADGVKALVGKDFAECDVKRFGGEGEEKRAAKPTKEQLATLKEGEQAVIHYVSTRDVDRDGDILLPEGAVLSEFKKAPQVLEGHDYTKPPIGKDEWIEANEYGLLAKTVYAPTPRGQEYFALRKGGFLATASVGLSILESVRKGDAKFEKLLGKLTNKYEELEKTSESVGRIITKWLLLEHSDVSVPANINALTVAVAKGQVPLSKELQKELGIEIPEPEPEPPAPEPEVKQFVRPVVRLIRGPEYVRQVLTDETIAKEVVKQLELRKGRV